MTTNVYIKTMAKPAGSLTIWWRTGSSIPGSPPNCQLREQLSCEKLKDRVEEKHSHKLLFPELHSKKELHVSYHDY